jgi:superfamily II RNA helicase
MSSILPRSTGPPDFTRTDWAPFHATLEAGLSENLAVNDEEAIDKCVEMTSAIQVALAASAPKSRPCTDPWPPLTARIQDETRLKNRLRRQWQVTRDPALKAPVNRFQKSVTYRLNEWKNDQWSNTLESSDSEDQSLWKMTRREMRVPTPSPHCKCRED